jgi:hypothetical protein
VLHPGRAEPELAPDEDLTFPSEAGPVRLRRIEKLSTLALEEVEARN